jgi:hypothetical protein
MKVICIKDSEDIAYTRKGPQKTPENMRIFYGYIYTVVDEVVGYKGELKWVLAERPRNCRYRKLHFAILSDKEEIKQEKEVNKLKQYLQHGNETN